MNQGQGLDPVAMAVDVVCMCGVWRQPLHGQPSCDIFGFVRRAIDAVAEQSSEVETHIAAVMEASRGVEDPQFRRPVRRVFGKIGLGQNDVVGEAKLLPPHHVVGEHLPPREHVKSRYHA